MLNSKLFELVGRFDQQFSPAYHEDSDMHKRIEQSGLKGYNTENALFYHVEAATLKGCLDPDLDPELEADKLLLNLRSCIRDNDQRFIKKWGALP